MTTESITEEEILSERFPPLFKGNIRNKDMGGPCTILDALRLDICENVDQSHFEKKISFPCGLFFKNETMARSDPREGWGAKFRIAHQRHHAHANEPFPWEIRGEVSPDGKLKYAMCECDHDRGMHRNVSYSDRPGGQREEVGDNTVKKPEPVGQEYNTVADNSVIESESQKLIAEQKKMIDELKEQLSAVLSPIPATTKEKPNGRAKT